MNRGNYRYGIFAQGRSGEVFEELLFESCERFGWNLYAYCVMKNHYHLALETPEANLSVGMQWLQSVFGNRFNRFVKTPGHVFQGRYKAPVVERGVHLMRVIDYIHLNPVVAGVVSAERLDTFLLSSFPKLLTGKHPDYLKSEWLKEAGYNGGAEGMRDYWRHLEISSETDPNELAKLDRSLCRGWYIGSGEGKTALLKDIRDGGGLIDSDLAKLDARQHALALLELGLKVVNRDIKALATEPKGSFWKASLCRLIHSRTSVSNNWLSQHLHLGHPNAVSRIRQRQPKTRAERTIENRVQSIQLDSAKSD
jgi:REP element-mobilizing transposase RayT